jgi:hypothetical protein
MSVRTFVTPFTSGELGRLVIGIANGQAVSFADPGVYTLSALQGWYIHTADDADVGDMTSVDGGEAVEITVTDTPITRYLKLGPERVGQTEVVVIEYDQTDPGDVGDSLTEADVQDLIDDSIGALPDGLTGFTTADNTGLGTAAGNSITDGTGNTTIGVNAGTALTTGSNNTAEGSGALALASTGNANTAFGADALGSATTSSTNTGLGSSALGNVTTGGDNTGVGRAAGNEIVAGTGNTCVGKSAGLGQGDVSNKFMVGLGNGQGLIFEVDEVGHLLDISVRYADGTMKAIAGLALT